MHATELPVVALRARRGRARPPYAGPRTARRRSEGRGASPTAWSVQPWRPARRPVPRTEGRRGGAPPREPEQKVVERADDVELRAHVGVRDASAHDAPLVVRVRRGTPQLKRLQVSQRHGPAEGDHRLRHQRRRLQRSRGRNVGRHPPPEQPQGDPPLIAAAAPVRQHTRWTSAVGGGWVAVRRAVALHPLSLSAEKAKEAPAAAPRCASSSSAPGCAPNTSVRRILGGRARRRELRRWRFRRLERAQHIHAFSVRGTRPSFVRRGCRRGRRRRPANVPSAYSPAAAASPVGSRAARRSSSSTPVAAPTC